MAFNPNNLKSTSNRLKGYDYSQKGLYFITIVCNEREPYFGKIELNSYNGKIEMLLNSAGKMIQKWYFELEQKYPDKKCHEMIIMPNHFHCILENTVKNSKEIKSEKEILSSTKNKTMCEECKDSNCICPKHNPPKNTIILNSTKCECLKYGNHNIVFNATIGTAIGWLKAMTTNEYIHGVNNLDWEPFNGKLWQKNYWDSIIFEKKSYLKISNYIKNNPQNWNEDRFNDDIL